MLAEMAEAAVSNPLGDRDSDEEDTDAALIEDPFARARTIVCDEGGAVRRSIALLHLKTVFPAPTQWSHALACSV